MTRRVSVDQAGGDADGASSEPGVTADGGLVVFESTASDLVGGDGNGLSDIFLRDMTTGAARRVSQSTGGGDPNGSSFDAAITPNGRYVAFDSRASNLVANDTNAHSDVFVRDTVTRTTRRVSVDSGGGNSDGDSFNPSMSANGRYVAFWSLATDLVSNDLNGVWDIFLRDMTTGVTRRVSEALGGGDPDLDSEYPSISASGRFVAFTSAATNLVTGDLNATFDVFVRDTVRGVTRAVSVDWGGQNSDGASHGAGISADGRYVSFYSLATDLVPDDGNFLVDVFRRDMQAGTTVRVSVDVAGADPNGSSFDPSISANGQLVAFRSAATDLVGDDTNGMEDVFAANLATGAVSRVSVDSNGADANNLSYAFTGALSSSGNFVAFWSFASDLVTNDHNGLSDVFLRRLS